MDNKVEIIAPTKITRGDKTISASSKIRVAAYARVSTGSDEQATSFDNQVDEWTKRLTSNPNYELVKIYTDEGITGTSDKKRLGFQQMIADAHAGKIDLIFCKSISRFARNTALSLQTVHELKNIGVGVHFDNEGINSLDSKSEFIFTVLSSMAQEESRHISENVTWTLTKKMKEGQPLVNTSRFLGYDKNDKGELVINEDEAKIIRYIFDLYDSGIGCLKIGALLQKKGYLTGAGGRKWHTSTITDILRNEKYVGDLLLQKTYTADYLGHIRKKNNGERAMYSKKNAHPAIISRELFDRVQKRLGESSIKNLGRNQDKSKYNNKYPLSGMMICLNCGHTYKRRLWNSKHETARKFMYQCTHYVIKDADGESCHSRPISEYLTEQIVCDIINKVYLSKSRVFSRVSNLLRSTLSVDRLIAEKSKKNAKKEEISKQIDDLIVKRREVNSLDLKEKIDAQYIELLGRYEQIEAEIINLTEREMNSMSSQNRLSKMLDLLSKKKITREMLNKEMLEAFFYKIIVCNSNEIVFVINASHSMNEVELVENRAEIIKKEAIYESSITGLDPVKKTTINYKVVLV